MSDLSEPTTPQSFRGDLLASYSELDPDETGLPLPEEESVSPLPSNGIFRPQVRMREVGREIWVQAEVPGYRLRDIEVRIEKDVLVLQGTRKNATPPGYKTTLRERPGPSLQSRTKLLGEVHPERAQATLARGILAIKIPMRERRGNQPIRIQVV